MRDNCLDVLASYELEKLQAGRVQKIVPWHSVEEYFQYWLEKLVLNDLLIMELVMQADACAEIFESSYKLLA